MQLARQEEAQRQPGAVAAATGESHNHLCSCSATDRKIVAFLATVDNRFLDSILHM